MIHRTCILAILIALAFGQAKAQYAYGDNWYHNPLGFAPLNLHTSMGFIIPAVAAGTCLLLTKKDTSLHHKLSMYSECSPSWGYKYPHTLLWQVNTGINYQLRKFMSVGVELGALFLNDRFNHTAGFDIKPFARFYAVNNKNWKLYFESGGGLVYALTEFPQPTDQDLRRGLQLNGITKYGIGSELTLSGNTSVLFGIRHLHISNGNIKGVERNPSHDSNGFFLGVTRKFN